MPTNHRKQKSDDMDIAIAIMQGAEWCDKDIARHFGISSQAICMRRKRDREHTNLIERVIGWTKVAISRHIETRIQRAEADFEEQKKKLHKKGYRVINKTLDHGLSEDVIEPDQTHLKAAEMAIERVEGKALDRKAILSREEHVYRVEVDGDELDDLLHEVASINEQRKQLLLGAPKKEETIDDAASRLVAVPR